MGASWTIHNVGGAIGLVLAMLVRRLNIASTTVGDGHSVNVVNLLRLKPLAVEPAMGGVSQSHFTSGYSAAMGLLVVATVVALATIAGLRWVGCTATRRAVARGRHSGRNMFFRSDGSRSDAAE